MGDAFRKIMAEEGVKGLYAGATSPLMGAMAMNAMVFFSYGASKKVSAFEQHRESIFMPACACEIGPSHRTTWGRAHPLVQVHVLLVQQLVLCG